MFGCCVDRAVVLAIEEDDELDDEHERVVGRYVVS